MSFLRFLSGTAAGACCLLGAALSNATECDPAGGISPCFEADALRIPSGHARFAAIASPLSVPPGQAAFSLASSFVLRPLILNAPSPDPDGRDIVVVERELGLTLGIALGLGRALELDFSLPTAVARAGSGVTGVTSQNAPPLPRTAVKDPRVGLSWSLIEPTQGRRFGLESRLELSLPFGDEAYLAGYAGPALLPALDAELTLGRFVLGAELGARLGKAVDFASAREGIELSAAAGIAFGILEQGLLDVSLESFLRQPLESEPERGSATAKTTGPAAEWLLGVRSSKDSFSVLLGGGSGLPLARETHDGGATNAVYAPTAPAFRALAVLRYAPSTDSDR